MGSAETAVSPGRTGTYLTGGLLVAVLLIAVSFSPPLDNESQGANIGGGLVLLAGVVIYLALTAILVSLLATHRLSWHSGRVAAAVATATGVVILVWGLT